MDCGIISPNNTKNTELIITAAAGGTMVSIKIGNDLIIRKIKIFIQELSVFT